MGDSDYSSALTPTCPSFTHMYPAECDKIILVLHEEEFLLVFRVTIVRSAALLWYDDVGHSKRISGLDQTQKASCFYTHLNYACPAVCQSATQGHCLHKINTEHLQSC